MQSLFHLRFDLDRYSPENSKSRPSYAFQPGFAGKRICPGYKYAYVEAIIGLVTILRKFKVIMVEGQEVIQTFGLELIRLRKYGLLCKRDKLSLLSG